MDGSIYTNGRSGEWQLSQCDILHAKFQVTGMATCPVMHTRVRPGKKSLLDD
jgi:hypothetical protein